MAGSHRPTGRSKNILLLTGEFGTNAIEKILSGNDDDLLTQWKNSYINTLAGIDIESQGYIGNMTEQIASLYSVDLFPLQTQFQGVKDSVNDMTFALGEAANAIGIGDTQSNITSNQNVPTPPTSTDTSLESAIVNETETAMDSFDQHTEKLTNEVIPAIQAATEEMNTFNESADMDIEKTVTIHYETTGEKTPKKNILGNTHADGTVGNAFAGGTKNKELAQNEKNALRSEYGQTEMTVYPDNTYEITNEPVVSDLPKGTVIYNEEQTKKILESKSTPTGSVQSGEAIKEESKFKFGDKMYSDSEFKELVQGFGKLIGVVNPGLIHVQEQMEKRIKAIETGVINNNNQRVINNEIHVTLPNVTNNTSAEALLRDLQSLSVKKYQAFD